MADRPLPGLYGNNQIGQFVGRLPAELRLDILSDVIAGDDKPQPARLVSREEYAPDHCPRGRQVQRTRTRPQYARVQSAAGDESGHLLFFDQHSCRPTAPGLAGSVERAMTLLDIFPAETTRLLSSDPALHSATLDVLYIPGVGMWTSWLQFPAVAGADLHTVHVEVRVLKPQDFIEDTAAKAKRPNVQRDERDFTMLPTLLANLWRLGFINAWGVDNGDERTGSVRRVVVNVVPQHVDAENVSQLPVDLCEQCGTLLSFLPAKVIAIFDLMHAIQQAQLEEGEPVAPAAEVGTWLGLSVPFAPIFKPGDQGFLLIRNEDASAAAKAETLELVTKTAAEFVTGLSRFLDDKADQDRSAGLKKSIARIEIVSGGTTLRAFNLSKPEQIRVQVNGDSMTEGKARELNSELVDELVMHEAGKMWALAPCGCPKPSGARSISRLNTG